MIADRLSSSALLQQELLPFVSTPDGRKIFSELVSAAEERFPAYVDEARGLAAGAGVPGDHILAINLRDELLALGASASSRRRAPSACSDYLVTAPGTAFVAHNEDGADPANNHTYILSVPPSGASRGFTAYVYAGELPGGAFGWTSSGVGFTLNALHPAKTVASGVGRNFVSRHALEAETWADGIDRAQIAGRAFAHNWQVFTTRKDQFVSLEVGAPPSGPTHVRTMRSGGDALFHANCYLWSSPSADASQPWDCLDKNADSAARMAAAHRLPVPGDLPTALRVLGDESDPRDPIYASPAHPGEDGRTTLNTVVFDLVSGNVTILRGNPERRSVCRTLQMPPPRA